MNGYPRQIVIREISPDGKHVYIALEWEDGSITEGWRDLSPATH